MSLFPVFRWPYYYKKRAFQKNKAPTARPSASPDFDSGPDSGIDIRRYFFNQDQSQCYASFFAHWGGWITAGHVLTDSAHAWPDFTGEKSPEEEHIWPGGLDAALTCCTLPSDRPQAPVIGQRVIVKGYPAGSRFLESRKAAVYLERGAGSGTWIARITIPDEPVVAGMSGGPVIDTDSGQPIGILITRNSPADLNADRDPDESCDFIALDAVWRAVRREMDNKAMS